MMVDDKKQEWDEMMKYDATKSSICKQIEDLDEVYRQQTLVLQALRTENDLLFSQLKEERNRNSQLTHENYRLEKLVLRHQQLQRIFLEQDNDNKTLKEDIGILRLKLQEAEQERDLIISESKNQMKVMTVQLEEQTITSEDRSHKLNSELIFIQKQFEETKRRQVIEQEKLFRQLEVSQQELHETTKVLEGLRRAHNDTELIHQQELQQAKQKYEEHILVITQGNPDQGSMSEVYRKKLLSQKQEIATLQKKLELAERRAIQLSNPTTNRRPKN